MAEFPVKLKAQILADYISIRFRMVVNTLSRVREHQAESRSGSHEYERCIDHTCFLGQKSPRIMPRLSSRWVIAIIRWLTCWYKDILTPSFSESFSVVASSHLQDTRYSSIPASAYLLRILRSPSWSRCRPHYGTLEPMRLLLFHKHLRKQVRKNHRSGVLSQLRHWEDSPRSECNR